MTIHFLYSRKEADASVENCASYEGRFCDGAISATASLLQTQFIYSVLTTFRLIQSMPCLIR